MDRPTFRRPAMLEPAAADSLPGDMDPAIRSEIAHETADALIYRGAASGEPEVRERLLHVVESEGLELIANLWADMPASTLPGTLWRIFALMEWIRRDPSQVAERYRLGVARAEVDAAVAGAAVPPGLDEMSALALQILTGTFDVFQLDVALERAAAFCRVMATGMAFEADLMHDGAEARAERLTRRASNLQSTATDLAAAAALWRAGKLD